MGLLAYVHDCITVTCYLKPLVSAVTQAGEAVEAGDVYRAAS